MIQMILSLKVSFWFTKEISQQRNSTALTEEPSPHIVRRNKMLWQKKRTPLPIPNIDFAKENKTHTQ